MRVMNQALTSGLDFQGSTTTIPRPPFCPDLHQGRQDSRCALVYMDDDCLTVSGALATLERHLLVVAEALEIFRRLQLYAKSSKCKFGQQELGFLGHQIPVSRMAWTHAVEWATSLQQQR